ncbi:MAG TPA: dTDP-4-dehydrorhamnose reductase [Actinomycetota bacterium]
MRILVTGAGGQLGYELGRALAAHDVLAPSRADLDVADAGSVARALADAGPDVVIHAAAWTDVDGCERDPGRARAVNTYGTRNVARARGSAFLVAISTDYVFDGRAGRPYVETDEPNPIQVYGATKLDAEREITAAAGSFAILRTAWLYGARRGDGTLARNFVTSILSAARTGPLDVVRDQIGSPTSCAAMASAVAAVIERRAEGVLHAVDPGIVSRFELARAAVGLAGLDPALVRPVETEGAPALPAARPTYAPLDGHAWRAAALPELPPFREALEAAMPAILETMA